MNGVAISTHGRQKILLENLKIENYFGDQDGNGSIGPSRNLIHVWAGVSGLRIGSGGDVLGILQ
jgi:hypothetical protein